MALTKITSRILDSSGVTTVGTISTGVWQGTAINQTYLVGQSGTNTGDETLARINALNITELGTISSGVWQGSVIAEAYLQNQSGTNTGDQTNISGNAGTVTNGVYTVGNQTIGGVKTFSSAATFNDSITLNGPRYLVQRSNDDSSIAFANNASGSPSSHTWAIGLNYSNSNAFTIAYGSSGIPSLESSKLVMKTDGNVGIGTTSPAQKLHILHPSYLSTSTVQGLIRLTGQSNSENSGTIPSAGTSIEFYNKWTGGSEYSVARIAGRASQGYDGGLQFDVGSNSGPGQSGFTTAMSILANSNVGIGTTSPDYQLDIENSSHAVLRIHAGTNSSASLRLKNDAIDWDVNCQTNDTFAVYNHTSNTQPFSILPNGNVGIGTASPSAFSNYTNVTLQGGSAGVNLDFKDSGGNRTHAIVSTPTEFIVETNNTDPLIFKTNNAERMRIASGGQVAIGTGTNTTKFRVLQSANSEWTAQFINTGTSPYGVSIDTTANASSNPGLAVYTNLGTGFFVKNDASVGIGTTSPSGKLHLISSGGTDGLRINAGTSSSNNGLVVNNEADNATLFYVRGNGDSAVGGNFTVNNKFYQNSVGRICNSGSTNGAASFFVDYAVTSQSSLKVTAVFNHYGYITSYGCSRFSLVGIGPAITTVDISNVTSGNGGSWGISRINSTTLRVTKNAGTYAGSGYWFIEIIGAQV